MPLWLTQNMKVKCTSEMNEHSLFYPTEATHKGFDLLHGDIVQ